MDASIASMAEPPVSKILNPASLAFVPKSHVVRINGSRGANVGMLDSSTLARATWEAATEPKTPLKNERRETLNFFAVLDPHR